MSKRKMMGPYGMVFATLAALACAAGIGWADSPHFIKATGELNEDGSLTVSWKEAGLGDNELISYIASADATATYHCVNNGGQCPNAANKTTVSGPVSAEGTFASGRNGQITQSLTIAAPAPNPGDFECPAGQTLRLSEIGYTNIQVTDVTNSVSEPTTPSSLTAVLFVCP
jgi:hypothetical protein